MNTGTETTTCGINYQSDLTSQKEQTRTKDADCLILLSKIRIELGAVVASTMLSTFVAFITIATLLTEKLLLKSELNTLMSVHIAIFGVLLYVTSIAIAQRSFRRWKKHIESFRKENTKAYNLSVDANPILPMVARPELHRASLYIGIVYYIGLFGLMLIMTIICRL